MKRFEVFGVWVKRFICQQSLIHLTGNCSGALEGVVKKIH